MSEPQDLPTHADEIDVLRLYNAKLLMGAAIRAAHEAAANAEKARLKFLDLVAAAEKKYQFSDAAGEAIDVETFAINRVKRGG